MLNQKLSNIVKGANEPKVLYHGSAFMQNELKPGYAHTGKIVSWDKYESNTYLYATDNREEAMFLGFSSAIEKKYKLKKTKIDHRTKSIALVFEGKTPSKEEVLGVEVYLYTLKYDPAVWMKNRNPFNNIDGEYKTKSTITDILRREEVDLKAITRDWVISIS